MKMLDANQHAKAGRIFLQAADLPLDKQGAYLDEACANDSDLRSQVEALLASDPGVESTSLEHPEQIGQFTINRILGEGGMGTVFLAEQQPARMVALKVIRRGFDSATGFLKRLENEGQLLARLNHPNVAHFYEAGSTTSGLPYFAMEYVEGESITKYCDTKRLNLEQRLKLFMTVCEGVKHLHQKGIIHRDLKPSNVLVAVQDEKAVPKIIDFGVAKATGLGVSTPAGLTLQGQWLGTPAYMSPEQAGGNPLDVDTRSDVYSLGVLLYEILVGVPPLEFPPDRANDLAVIQRVIRETEPPKPSTRLARMNGQSSSIALARGAEVHTLIRRLQGDIDWIVVKCLEKDRTRRYDSANALAMDIQRFIDNEPLLAGPPSATYRLRKFGRRHRGTVVAGVVILMVSIGATFLSSRQAILATRAREKAVQEQTKSQARLAFLVEVLSVDPRDKGKVLSLREVLDEACSIVADRFSQDPLAEAWLRHTLAISYRGLGLAREAEKEFRHAYTIRARFLGEEHSLTLQSLGGVASALLGREPSNDGLLLAVTVYEKQRASLGLENPRTLLAMHNLGGMLQDYGRHEEAERILRQTYEIRCKILGQAHRDTLNTLQSLSNALHNLGRLDEAEALFRTLIPILRESTQREHVSIVRAMGNLASTLSRAGKLDEARRLQEEVVDGNSRLLGPTHPETLTSMSNLGEILNSLKETEDAEEVLTRTLVMCEDVLSEKDLLTAHVLGNLAIAKADLRKYEEADELNAQALARVTEIFGPGHPDTRAMESNIAILAYRSGQLDRAEKLLRAAFERDQSFLGKNHRITLTSAIALGAVLRDLGKVNEALGFQEEVLEECRRTFKGDHPITRYASVNVAQSYYKLGLFAEAEALYRPIVELRSGGFRPALPELLESLLGLSRSLRSQSRFADAEQLLLEHYNLHKNDRFKQAVGEELALLYQSWDVAEPDSGHAERAAEWRTKLEHLEPGERPTDEATKTGAG